MQQQAAQVQKQVKRANSFLTAPPLKKGGVMSPANAQSVQYNYGQFKQKMTPKYGDSASSEQSDGTPSYKGSHSNKSTPGAITTPQSSGCRVDPSKPVQTV